MKQEETYFGFDSYATISGIDYTKLVGDDENFDNSNVSGSKTQEFIDKYKGAVIKSAKGTGLFPSVIMAQMIIESSWGQGITAKQANNFFGVKADKGWTGEKMIFNTPRDAKKQNYFRVYQTPLDSIADHNRFLQVNSRYPKAGVFSATTPEQQIQSIAKAGYAEAGKYDKAIIALINAYHLKDLDGVQGYKLVEEEKKLEETQQQLNRYVKRNWLPIALIGVGVIGLVYVGYKYRQSKLIGGIV